MTERFVDTYLLYLLARASSEVSEQFHDRLKSHELQVPEWRVLASLSDGDGMTVGELANRALQHQPTMTKTIDRMEKTGLVERRQGDPDRRQVRVFITPEGRRRVDAALKDAKRHEQEVLAEYSADEAARLKSMLQTLIERNGSLPNDD
ncbi:MAG: MarR family winged helix-turn-helix transcriptional regulator [Alphaproteobacteria bacterium]